MRSTTLFVWIAIALAACAGLFPASDALAQFQFDGTTITCVHDPNNNDGIINTIGDSIELNITIGGLKQYRDVVDVGFNPISGFGTIPTVAQDFECRFAVYTGHLMIDTVIPDSGISTINTDSMKIRARYRFRPEGLCGLNPAVTYKIFARAVQASIHDTICGDSPTYSTTVPCSLCTGCGYIRMEELCGFVDGIIAIGDRVFLDTAAVAALDAALPAPPAGQHDTIYVNFSTLNCVTVDEWRDTVSIVGDVINVVECMRENGVCGDSFQIRRLRWTGNWPPDEEDIIGSARLSVCVRPVDNVRPWVEAGMIDSFRIINGNYIRNDTLAGCFDTLRIYMATDSSQIAAGRPFAGDVDGIPYRNQCNNWLRPNFDMSWIGVWFGDFMPGSDTSGYPHNSIEKGLLCPVDTLLWMSARFGSTPDPGSLNNLMWIDIPFNPADWDSLQACILDKYAAGDYIYLWGFDDAGNRSRRIIDTADVCIDVEPPNLPLGSDIYSDGDCIQRFSPYDQNPFAHMYTNLSPDSIVWIKARVDTMYDRTDPASVFNDVYYIGFDARVVAPQDTAPIARLDWLHPLGPLPQTGNTLDTLRWGWLRPYYDDVDNPGTLDSLQDAFFTWYGKIGTDSIDPVLGTGDTFWKCGTLGGSLRIGITFARWLDASGCNRILGSDHDLSTNIDNNYTNRNQLTSVLDMCKPTTTTAADTLTATNLPAGPSYDPAGPAGPWTTYMWVGPNGTGDDPELRFRPRRIFSENPNDICQTEDTLYYRIRVDTVDLIYPLDPNGWPLLGVSTDDSVRWYSGSSASHASYGSASPGHIWSPITFNAGDIDAAEIRFNWGHKYNSGANSYLPDGLYRLTLELKDEAGNVYRDPIYVWLNGWGPDIDSLRVVNIRDTSCTYNFYTTETQDTLAIWLRTDTTADRILIDWSCVYKIEDHPAIDTTYATLIGSTTTFKTWLGYLIITPDMVSDDPELNVYEVAPWEEDCNVGAGGLRIINVRALDIAGADTILSEADPTHDCDKAMIGLTPCPRLITSGDYPLYEDMFFFANPRNAQPLTFGDAPDEWHAISPGKMDSTGGAGTYHALTNWANDQVQDSIYLRLLLDSVSIRSDTLDTLIVQFINPNYNPVRIREVRKPLFRPQTIAMSPDPVANNTIYHGRLTRAPENEALVEFRYFWNGTWFIGAGQDSIMLVPFNQEDTIIVKAFVRAVDSLHIVDGDTTVYYAECPDTLRALLDVDNINPAFRASTAAFNWSGVLSGRNPITGSTPTVKNEGWDANGDGDPEDCGFRFADGENFALKVKMSEELHHNPLWYPNTDGSHTDAGGYFPITRAWQISAINLRTTGLFKFGSDTVLTYVDSVVATPVNADSVYYMLYGHFDFPASAAAWFALHPEPIDSVALVIRSAWDEAGNPGRLNNPVFNDGLENDATEDTTFRVTFYDLNPWAAGCPLVWGVPDSVLGWIAAEEDSIIVKATIIETGELTECSPGVKADSIHILEGNFQTMTDDPNPWVLWNQRGPWYIYPIGAIGEDRIGWARDYTWKLRADSADLATIHCDGDYLPFQLRFNTYVVPTPLFSSGHQFDECVQVDVNEPRWAAGYMPFDTLGHIITACLDPRVKFVLSKQFSDDHIDCQSGDGVGVLTGTGRVEADLSILLGNEAKTNVAPDSIRGTTAYWVISGVASQFACIDSAIATVKFWALTDSLHHYDRELYDVDTLYFCSDCVPPELTGTIATCECIDIPLDRRPNMGGMTELHYVRPGGLLNFAAYFEDADHDSSSGIDLSSLRANLAAVNPIYGWANPADTYHPAPYFVIGFWGFPECKERAGSPIIVRSDAHNGDTLFVDFVVADNAGNQDTTWRYPVAIVDTLPPIVDYVYTIGDDSIRAYVTPADEHVHIWADLTGYAADLVSSPNHVWADLSRFRSGADAAEYDSVPASRVDSLGPNHFRAYWGWAPTESFEYPIEGDTLSLISDTLSVSSDICEVAHLGAEGFYDTLWVHVTDGACNVGSAFSVFEISGCDSTVPAVDFIQIWGNNCHEGWISATPLDSGHIEVWAWMDTVFNSLNDTLLIDSIQANLAQLGSDYTWTQWTPDLEGGAPVYGVLPDDPELVQTMWEMEGNRLVAKWIYLTARNMGCLDTVVVGVKAIRQTGQAGSHGYYIDVEYGWARVDTTRPLIYDMRVHSSTTSYAETTWVSPNVPLYVDVWAWDSNCDTVTDHLGFDFTQYVGGPSPFITFCNQAGFDTIWSWDTTAYTVLHQNLDSLDKAWVVLRFIGQPIYNDTCNEIDLDNITGCIEAHIEDCLSNPAVPVQRQATTDDRPPDYVMSNSWGDFTHVTGFPGNPDHVGVDSVLVLQNSVYALDWDSLLTVYVIVDNAPGDTLIRFSGTYINFDPQGPQTFLNTPIQYVDEVWYNIDGNHRDSLVWHIPLYVGADKTTGPLFNTSIPSDRYWFQLVLADTMTNNTGDPLRPEQPLYHPFTLFCDDLDSAITFTIQNWNRPNPGMILLCDSNTVAGSDTDFVDSHNMALWNNEFISPDTTMKNLYKIYYAPGEWAWYSHEDENQTRFFIFVEDTVLQSDGIDNDADGLYDEIGEGVDFYTADLRINNYPQVGHVDSMNVEGVWINYLWFADNFDQQRYDVSLYISDIYGHRDTLMNKCENTKEALQFFEDESCPVAHGLSFFNDGSVTSLRVDNAIMDGFDLTTWTADDSMFVFANFDSISIYVVDPSFLIAAHVGSGPDLDTTTVDSINYNDGLASEIELLGPDGNPVLGFVQRYQHDYEIYAEGPLTLVDPTGVALDAMPDGWYTVRVTLLDRVGNSCVRTWSFRLDRTCPDIQALFTTRPGMNTPTDDLFSSWDYVEIVTRVADSLDGVDSVLFDYCYDANRDGILDAYPYWRTVNILTDEGGAWDTEYPFIAYWNIRNLPWNSEDTLGLPPVRPDSCMNRYFVRVKAKDIYGHQCEEIIPVDITDDVAPLAYIARVGRPGWGWDNTPQGAVVPCYNPNTGLGDSLLYVYANDYVTGGYDPNPSDLYFDYDRWFDLAKGVCQFKFFEAPGTIIPGNTDPALGWVNMWTPGQDTVTYRNWMNEFFIVQWNIKNLPSHQYNIRFVGIDVCGNADPLNTPVITVRMECDTTAPIAVVCEPAADARITNWRCNEDSLTANDGWVAVKSASGIWADIDSIAFFFVDSLSVPGLGIHTFIGGDPNPEVQTGMAMYGHTRWNTNNLLSGYYWLYAVAYDQGGLFDTNPIWQRLYVDNTAPVVDSCMSSLYTTNDGAGGFYLSAYASDPDGGNISKVLFQYLDRRGNWVDLPNNQQVNDVYGLYGADVYAGANPDRWPDYDGRYEIYVEIWDFEQSPLDSIRFRAIAVDTVDVGNSNWQGDRNRDCNIDRDLICGTDVCCVAVEIRDQVPDSTNLWAFNHGSFNTCCLPRLDTRNAIGDGEQFSTCNYQNPLDTLLLVAKVHSSVEDGWLMHFKFRRTWPEENMTVPLYVPNDLAVNPTIPALGPIVLYHSWDSVYVIWTGAKAYIDSADAADGLWYSQWSFSAQTEDLTGNLESLVDRNTIDLIFACLPNAPITDVSYVANDVTNPDNRVRITEEVNYTDFVPDTIEVIYNRTTGPGVNDPEAMVIFYTDAPSIMNCRENVFVPFNIRLYELNDHNGEVTGRICPTSMLEPFGYAGVGLGWDQSPPDDNMNNRYAVGLYLDNTWGPGVYQFAMVVRLDSVYFPREMKAFWEGDSDLDDDFDSEDSTRVDLVVRVVNVNEPELSICYPTYGDQCVSGTVPMSASVVENPEFTGVIDTVWFQYFDGTNWLPIVDPVTGLSYDTEPNDARVFFEMDENAVPGIAGDYYDASGHNVGNPLLSWYAERDMFPGVWLWVDGEEPVAMTRGENGIWSTYMDLTDTGCRTYGFIIDANDNNIVDASGQDFYVRDPKDPCSVLMWTPPRDQELGSGARPASQVCLCEYMINFPSRAFDNNSYNFRTVVGWHDPIAYHVIENPSLGDSIHVFFVDNEPAEATHDIEFDATRLSGGMFPGTPGDPLSVCNSPDAVRFVTDIQPLGTHNLVVEDICKVIYQVSLTSQPQTDHSWMNVDTVYSNNDMGWTESWPGIWVAVNPLSDNVDNDGDGLVDETHDVQAGNGIGEENVKFWTRSLVYDYCGNVYYSNEDTIWVDVSEPQACITQVGDVSPADNQVVIIPPADYDGSRQIAIVAQDMSYADPGILAVFQYRKINSGLPWNNIQAYEEGGDTVRHIGNTYTAYWDITQYNAQCVRPDPEGWYQLRAIAIDTVGNSDACDNVICQITIRLNDVEPAARIEIYQITNEVDTATVCGATEFLYITPDDPYCIRAIFAPTNIDTGLASLTFQYQTTNLEGETSEWRNLETIYDPINNGLNGDTTRCVTFQPRPGDIGQKGFNVRVIVEDYNGNDTSATVTFYADNTPPVGTGITAPSVAITGPCGDRCRLDNTPGAAMVTATFLPDEVSGEINVDQVWLNVVRDDDMYSASGWYLTRTGDATWTFDFNGDLCLFWANENLDQGCYYFWLYYTDCVGNQDSVAVTTECGGETRAVTDLICIDCIPAAPANATLEYMDFRTYDCVEEDEYASVRDSILDGTSEVGNQTVTICGTMPDYQQYVREVRLFVSSADAGVDSVEVDHFDWINSSTSIDSGYCFTWDLTEEISEGVLRYPSGYYRVWVLAIDAVCLIQNTLVDEFYVHVDNTLPIGWITQINGQAPNPEGPDIAEVFSGEDDSTYFWVEWSDGLIPNDSTQLGNHVQLYAKLTTWPNQSDAWHMVGYTPSPCNPHFVFWRNHEFTCGETIDVVAVVEDRWDNGEEHSIANAMLAFDEGRTIDLILRDTTPPHTQLWSIGLDQNPANEDSTTIFDQQAHVAHIASNFVDQDVYLHVFSALGDPSIRRVFFEYSLDGTTWFEIGVDSAAVTPPSCTSMTQPVPWWCDYSGVRVLWTHLWDISGLRGHVLVRTWSEDICGNLEEISQYAVTIDVMAPMAKVYVWNADSTYLENIPCQDWSRPQMPDTVERYTVLSLGACPDSVGTVHYDAFGTYWYVKAANDNPLDLRSWCDVGHDLTGPFTKDNVKLWDRYSHDDCLEPEVGSWYDVAVLTTDQMGHTLTWPQFLNAGEGITWEEKWQWLINNGYVKRFKVTDHTAPVAHTLRATPDQTADSSIVFLTGRVDLSAYVNDPDVVAVTFAVREQGATGPWTIIQRVEGDSMTHFEPAGCAWNTDALNGTYIIGAFAEDYYGNMDGDPNVASDWPTNTIIVNVDNERPNALIVNVTRDGNVVTRLEQGAYVTFNINATDNFGVQCVYIYFRHAGEENAPWRLIGGQYEWPYSLNWTVPESLVTGWTYEFAAIATDWVNLNDLMNDQGNYIVDATYEIVDLEANISIETIGGQNAETVPHVNGEQVCLGAASEPRVRFLKFLWIRDADTTVITTMETPTVPGIGEFHWVYCGWDVTAIPEGPAQLCAVGSADEGPNWYTIAQDCRNIVIDHSLPYVVDNFTPASHGLVGGYCEEFDLELTPDDLWIRFNPEGTDAGIDTVWFDWKWATDPNDSNYWSPIGLAVLDQGLTGRWAYPWLATLPCGTVTLRARVQDNAVPKANEVYIIFADSVRVDNCAPEVEITNVNGDVTPNNTQVPRGAVANIVATVIDQFAQGGNSTIDSVIFWARFADRIGQSELSDDTTTPPPPSNEWIYIGHDSDGAPWQTLWNTGGLDVDAYEVRAVAWDEAGNCGEAIITVNVVDQLTHRAWIVGWDADNEAGCDDNLYVLTDDCTPDMTTRVIFQYTTNNGQTWVNLGEDQEGYSSGCDPELYYQRWSITLEFDNIPANAQFHAIAVDAAGNFDPNPPRFQFSDVTQSTLPAVYHPEWVRVPALENRRIPWVFSMLEDFTENCVTATGLVCVRPWLPDSSYWTGPLPEETNPCANTDYDDRGRITIFRSVPIVRVIEGDTILYSTFTNYRTAIHEITFESGSNGWLNSEDGQMRLFVPSNATVTEGRLWFQPVAEADYVNLIPPSQYYYTLISKVEVIASTDLDAPTDTSFGDIPNEIRIKMRFNPSLLPAGYQPWQVVPAFWDNSNSIWSERGVVYVNRDSLQFGVVDFHYSVDEIDWDPSDWYTGVSYCNQIRFAVFLSTVPPIDEWVRFSDNYCDLTPDSTYYTPDRGPAVACDPTFWAVMRQGEYIVPDTTIDVYLDGIRIINNGRPDISNGYGSTGPIFVTNWNTESGIFSVRFSPDQYSGGPPWYGCLRNGRHTVQFYSNNLHTHVTPFWVDATEPEAFTYPEYINHQINLWANLTDAQSGVDTTSVICVVSDCTPSAFEFRAIIRIDTIAVHMMEGTGDSTGFYGDSTVFVLDSTTIGFEVHINDPTRAFLIGSEAMNFAPIPGGYRANFSLQWEQLHQWLIVNNNAGNLCVTWEFHNNVCQYNDSSTYLYTIDVEPPMVVPVSPIGAGIDDDGDGLVNEDWRDCLNNDNDGVWVDGVWQERIDEDPINFLPDTLMYGERPTIQAVMNDLSMCGSGASGVNVAGLWLTVDGQIFRIADTSNANINFRVQWPYGQQDDAYLIFGGTANTALDPFYRPGEHRITVAAPDSAGNVGSYQFSWTYYIRAAGPAIIPDTTMRPCGVWFNPEVSNYFEFTVNATSQTPIAANGIQYSVYTVPGGERISGPTTINPIDPMHMVVRHNLSGSFPDGQSGIEVRVKAWNILHIPEVDTVNGVTYSQWTYWADNAAPTFTNHLPVEGSTFNRDEAVVIEVFYTDDTQDGLNLGKGGTPADKTTDPASRKAEMRVSRLDKSGDLVTVGKSSIDLSSVKSRNGRGALDANGSGIKVSSFQMNIVRPNGTVLTPSAEDFVILDAAHAKYVLQPVHASGQYTVNVRVEDCVGNIGADSWMFTVISAAPAITFTPSTGDCQYDGYWRPDTTLYLDATIREVDGINTNLDGIHVDVVRVYNRDGGLAQDTILHDAEYTIVGEGPNPENTAQTFTIHGEYHFEQMIAATEIRVIIYATNAMGMTSVRVKPWIVDGDAPWITVVSPLNDGVVPQTLPVTISANFGDDPNGLMAMAPKGGNGSKSVATIKVGPQRVNKSTATKVGGGSTKFNLGSWADAVTSSSLDELDGNSGVDPTCVELLLLPHDGSGVRNLTETALIRASNVTWIGTLEAGSYTAILSVCDRVCNTASVNWDFAVAPDNAGVTYDPPYYVSSMPRTFTMHIYGENIDHTSMNLAIEGAVQVQTDTSLYEMWLPIVENAAVQWLGDSVWYVANVDLGTYSALRLTLRANYTYGIPVPTGSQVYVVDTGAPRIVSVTPDPQIVLPIGASPTFDVQFIEVGNTTLDPASIRVWLETVNSVRIEGAFTSSVDLAGRSGYGRLVVGALARDDYRLYAEVADIAGNRVFANWLYQVRDTSTVPIPAEILDKETAYNYPNPFNAGEQTRFWLPITNGAGAYVEIKVFDFAGRYVATVYDGYLTPNAEIIWDGRNVDGEMIANGVYLARCVTSADGKTKEDIVKVAFKNKK